MDRVIELDDEDTVLIEFPVRLMPELAQSMAQGGGAFARRLDEPLSSALRVVLSVDVLAMSIARQWAAVGTLVVGLSMAVTMLLAGAALGHPFMQGAGAMSMISAGVQLTRAANRLQSQRALMRNAREISE